MFDGKRTAVLGDDLHRAFPRNKKNGYSLNPAEDVYVATCLAENDDAINARKITLGDVAKAAIEEFAALKTAAVAKDGCAVEETIAATIYAKFSRDGVSKPIAAQYLAERLVLLCYKLDGSCRKPQGLVTG